MDFFSSIKSEERKFSFFLDNTNLINRISRCYAIAKKRIHKDPKYFNKLVPIMNRTKTEDKNGLDRKNSKK